MIHNHEVGSSILPLATKKSPGTKCEGFFDSGWSRKLVFKGQDETKKTEAANSAAGLFFVSAST